MSKIYIDDQDLSKVAYTGTWVRGGSPYEHEETVASSTIVGDYFVVTFKGTSVAVFGTFDATSDGVITTYSVDGAPPVRVTAQGGSGDAHRQQFWRSSQLSLAEHKLNVTMAKVNFDPEPGEGTVWFDYFLVTDPTITSSSAARPSSTQPLITKPQSSVPVGAIIGGVIGGLFFFLAVVCLLVFLRRRKQIPPRDLSEKPMDDSSHLHIGSVQPFLLGRSDLPSEDSLDTVGRDSGVTGSTVLPPRKSLTTIQPALPIIHPPGLTIEPSTTSHSTTDRATENPRDPNAAKQKPRRNLQLNLPLSPQSSSSPTEQHSARQHVDSGVRVQTIQAPNNLHTSSPVELPPVYSPA